MYSQPQPSPIIAPQPQQPQVDVREEENAVQPPPQVPSAPVPVHGHLREQSKSPANVLHTLLELYTKYPREVLIEKLAGASTVAAAGNTRLVNTINGLDEFLASI